MFPRHAPNSNALWRTLRLAWWGSLTFIHAAALVGVMRSLIHDGRDFSSVVSLVILLPALAFFTLKLTGASLLPHCPRLQSLAIFALVCGVAHNQAAGPWAMNMVVLPTATALVTASLAPEAAVALGRLKRRLGRLGDSKLACLFDTQRWTPVRLSCAPAPIWTLPAGRVSPRAPPA